jgi:hypothetical protein
VQFVKSFENLVNNQFCITYKPAANRLPQKNVIDSQAVANKPVQDYPFLDALPHGYPFGRPVITATLGSEELFFFKDMPGIWGLVSSTDEVRFKFSFRTYVVLSYPETSQEPGQGPTTYPLAYVDWQVFCATKSFGVDNSGTLTADCSDSTMPVFLNFAYIHHY